MSVRPPQLSPPLELCSGGVSVAYRRAGAGEPLVYFHGKGLTRRWLPLYELLSGSFDVVVPEHPGFGDTPRPRWFRTLEDTVLHQADVLSALGINRFHLVGHSLGGRIAASFAAVFPERVRTLTLIAPAPMPLVTPAGRRGRRLPDPLPADFDFDELLFSGDPAVYPDYRSGSDDGELLADADSDEFADPSAWRPDGSPSLYRRLARIRAPRQLLVPDADRVVDPGCFDDWARWLGDAEQVRIRGRLRPTGHLLIVQEPEQIVDAVRRLAGGASESVRGR